MFVSKSAKNQFNYKYSVQFNLLNNYYVCVIVLAFDIYSVLCLFCSI